MVDCIYVADGPARRVGARLTHKWKGWARLRTNPERVRPPEGRGEGQVRRAGAGRLLRSVWPLSR